MKRIERGGVLIESGAVIALISLVCLVGVVAMSNSVARTFCEFPSLDSGSHLYFRWDTNLRQCVKQGFGGCPPGFSCP